MRNHHNQKKQPATNDPTDPNNRREAFLRRKNVQPLSRREKLLRRFLPVAAGLGVAAVGAFVATGNVIDRYTVDDTTYSVDVTTYPTIAEGTRLALREAMETDIDSAMAAAAARVDVGEAAADITEAIYAGTGETAREQTGHVVTYNFERDGDKGVEVKLVK